MTDPCATCPACGQALPRHQIIAQLLQERPWQLPELAEYLQISERQLRSDLDQVRAAGWNVREEQHNLGRGAGRPKVVRIEPATPAPASVDP